MLLAALPVRTVRPLGRPIVPERIKRDPHAQRTTPEHKRALKRIRNRRKALKRSIKVCDRLLAILPGKRLTLLRELEALK